MHFLLQWSIFVTGVTGAALCALYKTKPTAESFYGAMTQSGIEWLRLRVAAVKHHDLIFARVATFDDRVNTNKHVAVGLLGTWIPLTDIPKN